VAERHLRVATAVLALLGAALAGYLVYVRASGGAVACATGGCETVQSSRYAEVFGVPVALVGLIGYLIVLGCAVAAGDLARLAQAMVTLSAFIFSAYLLFVQLHLVGAVCRWCLVSDVLTTALAVVALLRVRPATPPPR
jgi:uncharacterized membrane protein